MTGHRRASRLLVAPVLALIAAFDLIELAIIRLGWPYRILLKTELEGARWRLSAWRAWRIHRLAATRVPAYRELIEAGSAPRTPVLDGRTPTMEGVPETDKAGYVTPNGILRISVGGRLPTRGVVIDESSGSSGKPTSWARGRIERMVGRRMLQLNVGGASIDRPGFVINGLLLGTWAAGVNVSTSLADAVTIKSTGPDIDKIIGTMLQFGPGYRYFVMGYPPFLKMVADDDRLDWAEYETVACYGGEGMSEPMRAHLERRFKRVFGSYGAADLELGLAGESDVSIRLRRAIIEDEAVRDALVRTEHGVTPIVMQYDPLAYFVESNDLGELVFTVNRPWRISPRVRYNIHDLGHVMRAPEVRRRLQAIGRGHVLDGVDRNRDLPFLFLYRRSDRSVDYYGVVVSPDGVAEALHDVPALSPILSTFKLLSYEDERHDKKMEIAVELAEGAAFHGDVAELAEEVFVRIGRVNGDFRGTRAAAPKGNPPLLTIHPFGTGPFAGKRAGRVKDEYVSNG